MIKKLIEECIEKYYLEEEMYYLEDREDENGDDLSMKDELTKILTAKQVPFQISKEEGFDSPGYSEYYCKAFACTSQCNMFVLRWC